MTLPSPETRPSPTGSLSSTEPRTTWTVGHDGSAGATRAARWALTQAAGRHVQLGVVRSWDIPALEMPLPVESMMAFKPSQACDDFDALEVAATRLGLLIEQRVVRGAPAQVLIDASAASSLLVVGSRGLGGFRRLLLGSVSSQCAAHAQVPTVIVPESAEPDRPVRRIVVGLDGSERSQRALAWAREFAPEGCVIVAVGAWTMSKSGYVTAIQIYGHEAKHVRQRFDAILDDLEAEAQSTLFERRFVFDDPAKTLLDEASRADLIVVGKRGHSGLSSVILGSVATHVVHHSLVPVAIVPDE